MGQWIHVSKTEVSALLPKNVLIIYCIGTFFFREKFGLFAVNMSSPTMERIPKESAKFMHRVIKTREIPNIR